MHDRSFVVVLVLVCTAWVAAESEGDDSLSSFSAAFPRISKSDLLDMTNKLKNISLLGSYEACLPFGVPPDTDDIRNVRPGNIKVIAALGDSIIAGMSAKDTSIINLRDHRGVSFAMGGDLGVVSVVSLLKQFTAPNFPIGPSQGIGARTSAGNGFNGAVSGALVQDMVAQAEWLVARIRSVLTPADFATHWKLVTIWIGSNNLCDLCNDRIKHGAATFGSELDKTLDYLKANLPRTFVSLVANMDVTQIYNFKEGTCAALHAYECPCGASSSNATRTAVALETAEYIKALYTLEVKYKPTTDFAVVVQPFLQFAKIPARNWLSAADCFHPSAIAHEAMGIGLWNNLIAPKALKSNNLEPGEQPICASASTLIHID